MLELIIPRPLASLCQTAQDTFSVIISEPKNCVKTQLYVDYLLDDGVADLIMEELLIDRHSRRSIAILRINSLKKNGCRHELTIRLPDGSNKDIIVNDVQRIDEMPDIFASTVGTTHEAVTADQAEEFLKMIDPYLRQAIWTHLRTSPRY